MEGWVPRRSSASMATSCWRSTWRSSRRRLEGLALGTPSSGSTGSFGAAEEDRTPLPVGLEGRSRPRRRRRDYGRFQDTVAVLDRASRDRLVTTRSMNPSRARTKGHRARALRRIRGSRRCTHRLVPAAPTSASSPPTASRGSRRDATASSAPRGLLSGRAAPRLPRLAREPGDRRPPSVRGPRRPPRRGAALAPVAADDEARRRRLRG